MFSTCKPAIAVLFAIFLLSSPGCGHAAPAGLNRLGYAIQMGAFADVKNAERFTDTLQKKGIEAFYFRKDNGIYAVRFGDFATRDKARAAAKRLVADRLIGGYYIAPPTRSSLPAPGTRSGRNRPVKRSPPPCDHGRQNGAGQGHGPDRQGRGGGAPETGAGRPGHGRHRRPHRRTLRGHPLPLGRGERGGRHGLQRFRAGGLQPVRPQHPPDLPGPVQGRRPGGQG
ncbi:SPOR domain-containing protein [Geobacter sp. FeAm09]|nr:SPOR domain-containing protein [Geobacter sp. FeAm09]